MCFFLRENIIIKKYFANIIKICYYELDEREMAMNIKQENFKRIAENRVNKIIDMISKLENLNNASFYEYSDEQIDNIFNAIQNELDRQKEKFKRSKNTKKRFEL